MCLAMSIYRTIQIDNAMLTMQQVKPLATKTQMSEVVLCPGRSGGLSLWGDCLVGCIGSFREKVAGVAAKRLHR